MNCEKLCCVQLVVEKMWVRPCNRAVPVKRCERARIMNKLKDMKRRTRKKRREGARERGKSSVVGVSAERNKMMTTMMMNRITYMEATFSDRDQQEKASHSKLPSEVQYHMEPWETIVAGPYHSMSELPAEMRR